VEQAAAVLGVYTLVLAVALPVAAQVRHGALAAAGAVVFAAASLGCGLAGSIEALLALRGVQAAGGAALLVGAFALLDAGGAGRRAWTATAIFGFRRRAGARGCADAGVRLARDLPRPGPGRGRRRARRLATLPRKPG
jgi:hypothetical protein